ncbi:helix-turn-helix transcriptional regulator [Rhizobium multihospitium]|uniref:Transcriptional regulator, AlpA family n=1 Tax=Rhizobium multihospitium TaxID=410764 RepID=A0A1C3WLK3_9HYPH|nr:AlpA family phage regulatory protein [Rhizobium multihospitium]SCB40808.1 transcriptional regulator, AlpA family [Rhizobium multihospitium]
MSKEKKQFISPLMSPTEAAAMTTLSDKLLKLMAAEGQFPKPRKIGVRRIAFVRSEVMDWIDGKINGGVAA